MKKDVVTVVLPIYNVEKYLDRCLNSITNQTYKNLDIVLVDDGSTDSCPEICDKWASDDSRIKVIHKKNAGLGMARNTGIENADGEYIIFVDSDDYLAADAVEKIILLAKKEEADMIIFGFSKQNQDGAITESFIPQTGKVTYIGDEIRDVFLPDMISPRIGQNLYMTAWAACFSMDIIRKIKWRFASEREIISEDVYSLLFLYKHINRMAVLSESLYFHCENPVSLTNTYRSDRIEKIRYFYDQCVDASIELGYSDDVLNSLSQPYISFTIAALKMIITSDENIKKRKKIFREVILSDHWQRVTRTMDLKRENLNRKLFLLAVRLKLVKICYLFVKLKT